MKKLRLDVETLAVESFPVQADARGTGTVHAHSNYNGCGSLDCEGYTFSCSDSTSGQTMNACSHGCTYDSCNGCTIVH